VRFFFKQQGVFAPNFFHG